MRFRNLLLIVGTLAILVGVSIAGFLLLNSKPAVQSAVGAGGLSILVAARSLPSGAVLQDGDLEWKRLENRVAPPGSLSRAEVSATRFVGEVTRHDLAAGQVVTLDSVFDRSNPKVLAGVLAPGYRGVTIEVDAAQGGAGLILPDDRVDAVLVSQPGGMPNAARPPQAITLLRDVRVVAVDRTLQRPNVSDPKPDPNSSLPKTMTLEVTDGDAQRLLLATQVGKIQLALRSMARGLASPSQAPGTLGDSKAWAQSDTVVDKPRHARKSHGPLDAASSVSRVGAPIVILRGSKAAAS